MHDEAWQAIFDKYKIDKHNFKKGAFHITASMIKEATAHFKNTGEKEVRILCKQDSRESRPEVFVKKGLFILPVKNGEYKILKGEGYIDIPDIQDKPIVYNSKLDFDLDSSKVGDSEMQHLDYAYAASLIRTFMNDPSLVLTIRGRKYTPEFSFNIGKESVEVRSVQTEVDAGYEGREQIVLIEAKNTRTKNIIIRQLFYPFKQWKQYTEKKVVTLFFEKRYNIYSLWEFQFEDENDYNSVKLIKSASYEII